MSLTKARAFNKPAAGLSVAAARSISEQPLASGVAGATENVDGSSMQQQRASPFRVLTHDPAPKRVQSTFTQDEAGVTDVDVAIIGGGITGSALLYTLAEFTDLTKVVLLERRPQYACVASGPNNNSQTIHCGDIETNYTPAKARTVKNQANVLRNFLLTLPEGEQQLACARMQKMAVGVGDKECQFMEDRFKKFKEIFPSLQMLDKKQLAEVEPAVIYKNMSTRTARPENVVANFVPDEHSAVDYFHTTNNFIQIAQTRSGGALKGLMNTEMLNIQRDGSRGWLLDIREGTQRKKLRARFVVVSSCGYSILTAHQLGYARHLSCLPIAGSFYFGPEVLRGKVYTVQNPALPFAAVHGDPDLVAHRKTRFGPTALPLPLLERYKWKTLPDFLKIIRPSPGLVSVYWNLFKDSTTRNYLLKNLAYEIPGLKERLFLPDIEKIVPSIKLADIHYANGFGGVRPQIIDKKQRKLVLGEGKIDPPNDPIIFNVTPSPGGTTCLATAHLDTLKIVKFLKCKFDSAKYDRVLVHGPYDASQ